MKRKLNILIAASLILAFSSAIVANAAPSSRSERTILPFTDSLYDIGSDTLRWANGYFDNLDASTILISGASTGDLDMGGYQILNGGQITGTHFTATSTTATSTFPIADITRWVSQQGNLGLDLTDNGSDLILHSDVGGVNNFIIDTDGAFFSLTANPGPANGYLLGSITETQGADTQLNFYEGGTGHNRFWNSGSMRIGGSEGYLCSTLTSDVDCDTSGTGADLAVQDDIWLGGALLATSTTDTSIFGGNVQLSSLTSGSVPFINASNQLDEDTTHLQWDSTNNTLQLGHSSSEKTITISGIEYKSHLKVNETDDTNLAMLQLHKHSLLDAAGALIVASRSNSSSSGHGALASDQTIFGVVGAGWSDTDYDQAGQIRIESDGAFAANDAPGRINFWTTPSGSNTPLERLRIDSAGNVGIGTTTPPALLTLNDPAGVDPFYIGSSTPKFIVKDSGNVGIGTASPEVLLHVDGNVTNQNNAVFGTFGIQSFATANGFIQSNSYFNGTNQIYREDGPIGMVQFFGNGNVGIRTAPSGTAGNTATLTTRLHIDNTGNVGVGNIAPNSLLEIGVKNDASDDYLQIDSEAGAPPAADCDANAESGRMILDHTNDRVYICNQLSGRGWDYWSLTD